jgi:hypothetical protein
LSSFFFVIGSILLWLRVVLEPAAQQCQRLLDLWCLSFDGCFEIGLDLPRYIARFRYARFSKRYRIVEDGRVRPTGVFLKNNSRQIMRTINESVRTGSHIGLSKLGRA